MRSNEIKPKQRQKREVAFLSERIPLLQSNFNIIPESSPSLSKGIEQKSIL